jgi:hypothetical protein
MRNGGRHVSIGRMSTEATPRRLSIELQRDSEPITGRIADPAGRSERFSGWLELIAALERARTGEPGSGSNENDRR